MTFKDLVRDLTDNIGSISRRTFDRKFTSGSRRVRSQSLVLDPTPSSSLSRRCFGDMDMVVDAGSDVVMEEGWWADLPPELLRDVLQRVESADGSWPARKDVVACSAVCKTWREITKELVKTPEECGQLTFPISLKQVGLVPFSYSR